jgi:hypothetical protein
VRQAPNYWHRRLAWEGAELGDYFHAATDAQAVRDEVFMVVRQFPFTESHESTQRS